jgi:hypothetical protein
MGLQLPIFRPPIIVMIVWKTAVCCLKAEGRVCVCDEIGVSCNRVLVFRMMRFSACCVLLLPPDWSECRDRWELASQILMRLRGRAGEQEANEKSQRRRGEKDGERTERR